MKIYIYTYNLVNDNFVSNMAILTSNLSIDKLSLVCTVNSQYSECLQLQKI